MLPGGTEIGISNGSPLSLLLVDLDDFKRVNDRWGHVEGDAMLRKTGRMLRESSRHTDAVCRYGGDEFVLLLPETSSAEAYALAERVRKAPQRAALVPGQDGHEPRPERRTAERVPEVAVEQPVPRQVGHLRPVVPQELASDGVTRGVDGGERPRVADQRPDQRIDAVEPKE